jgi:hypothetical protein
MTTDPSRRDVLQGVLGVVALAPTSAAGGAPATDAETPIPAPFDAVPTLEEPPERLREIAGVLFPPAAVPDEGPIPDVHHTHTETVEITVPPWAFEAVRWRLDHADPDKVDRWYVEELLVEYAHADERFRTPDGHDAVAALLEATDADV